MDIDFQSGHSLPVFDCAKMFVGAPEPDWFPKFAPPVGAFPPEVSLLVWGCWKKLIVSLHSIGVIRDVQAIDRSFNSPNSAVNFKFHRSTYNPSPVSFFTAYEQWIYKYASPLRGRKHWLSQYGIPFKFAK